MKNTTLFCLFSYFLFSFANSIDTHFDINPRYISDHANIVQTDSTNTCSSSSSNSFNVDVSSHVQHMPQNVINNIPCVETDNPTFSTPSTIPNNQSSHTQSNQTVKTSSGERLQLLDDNQDRPLLVKLNLQYSEALGLLSPDRGVMQALYVNRIEAIEETLTSPDKLEDVIVKFSEKALSLAKDCGVSIKNGQKFSANSIGTCIHNECTWALENAAEISECQKNMMECKNVSQALLFLLQASVGSAQKDDIQRSFDINDFCFSLIEYTSIAMRYRDAFYEGIIDGTYSTGKKIITRPVETLKNMVTGVGTLAFGFANLVARYIRPNIVLGERKDSIDLLINDVGLVYDALKVKCDSMYSTMTGPEMVHMASKEATELGIMFYLTRGASRFVSAGGASLGRAGLAGVRTADMLFKQDVLAISPYGVAVAEASECIVDAAAKAEALVSTGVSLKVAWQTAMASKIAEKVSKFKEQEQNILLDDSRYFDDDGNPNDSEPSPDNEKNKKDKKKKASDVAKSAAERAHEHGFIPLEDELQTLEAEFNGKWDGFEEIGNKKITINFKHIFAPDSKKNGMPCGFHHNYKGYWTDKMNVNIVREGPCGTYVAQWSNGIKTKTSTFFPSDLNRKGVLKWVKEAYLHEERSVKMLENGILRVVGKAKNGIEISMDLTNQGYIETLFLNIFKK